MTLLNWNLLSRVKRYAGPTTFSRRLPTLGSSQSEPSSSPSPYFRQVRKKTRTQSHQCIKHQWTISFDSLPLDLIVCFKRDWLPHRSKAWLNFQLIFFSLWLCFVFLSSFIHCISNEYLYHSLRFLLLMTGIILFTVINFDDMPALVTSIMIGIAIVFCGTTAVQNVYLWQQEKTRANKDRLAMNLSRISHPLLLNNTFSNTSIKPNQTQSVYFPQLELSTLVWFTREIEPA